MLPEHVAMIRDVVANQNKVAKPVLDDQEIEEIERTISEAMSKNEKLTFTYWENGEYKTLIGKVDRFDQFNKSLRIIDEFGDKMELIIMDIVNVRFGE